MCVMGMRYRWKMEDYFTWVETTSAYIWMGLGQGLHDKFTLIWSLLRTGTILLLRARHFEQPLAEITKYAQLCFANASKWLAVAYGKDAALTYKMHLLSAHTRVRGRGQGAQAGCTRTCAVTCLAL